jgi:outer membrane protein assembly factor BamA
MIRIKKIFSFLFVIATIVTAQNTDTTAVMDHSTYKVDSIKIVGNEKTKDFIILREMSFTIGDSVNSEVLFLNRERIFSLGLFTRVELEHIQKGHKNIVKIMIEESWYIFPVPFIIVREKTFTRTSYGVSLKFKNVRGRNETIRFTFALGYDPYLSFEYENLLVVPSADVNFSLAGIYGSPVNKSPTLESINGGQFDFKTIGITTTWGKRINKQNNIFLLLEYSVIKAPTQILTPYMASGSDKDKELSIGLSYSYDSRNLKQFANRGGVFQFTYIKSGIGSKEIDYNTMSLDTRGYTEIYKSLILKGRLFARHTFGKYVPYYHYSILGYNYYTRGNRTLVREGNNMLLGSIELAHPIISEWNFAIDLPVLPNSLTRARIAVMGSIFVDAATVFNNNQTVLLNDFNSGYGFGITLLFLPYSSFRIEYAFNEFGIGEFLLETGISF